VVGEGPIDLVFVPGGFSHLDLNWTLPGAAAFFERLASFSRLIHFDTRGTGLSDPVPGPLTLEERMEDLHAVLDAVGAERVALFGASEGGPMSILFAATHPERTSAIALYGTTPAFLAEDISPRQREAYQGALSEFDVSSWGEGHSLFLFGPSIAGDARTREEWGAYERASASPAMVRDLSVALAEITVSEVLPVIGAPTLILHRSGDRVIPVEGGRMIAERLPDARYVELPGDDHLPFVGDSDAILDEVERFFTGTLREREPDRALATVLFTDIVSSTERAAELGDRRWRELLERHDADVRAQVEAGGGRVVKSLGDGYLATFDGPARAIRCARALVDGVAPLGLELRAGVHTGECELLGDDVGGMAVHIGARISALAAPGEVLVSSAVRDLVVGSGIEFEDRGAHELKGVPGRWNLLSTSGG
jgi:class 3 adenylate cyclase